MDNKNFSTLMYFLIREASKYDFIEFLENIGLTIEDYDEIIKYLEDTYGVEVY